MPFITEEIWHLIEDRNENDCIIIATWPTVGPIDTDLINNFETVTEVISAVRNIRKEKNIPFKEALPLFIKIKEPKKKPFDGVIAKLSGLNEIIYTEEKVENAFSFRVKANEYFVPLSGKIDILSETKKLKEELEYTKGFLESVMKKLSNEKFVANAKPEIIEIEKKKQAEAKAKIKVIEEQLLSFSSN